MDNLIKQLNKLPKKRLPLRADFNLRLKLYKMIWKKRLNSFSQSVQLPRLKPVPALIIILLCLFIIVPGYAYASNQVTRSHPLYPLKQGLEKVEVSLAISAPAKAETYTKLADRRLAEAEVISQQKDDNNKEEIQEVLVETIAEAVQLSNKADQETQNINKVQVQSQVQDTINKTKEIQQNTLSTIAHTVSIKAEEKVLDSIALAFEAFKPKWPERKDGKGRLSEEMTSTSTESGATSSPAITEEDEEKTETVKPFHPLPMATSTIVPKPEFKIPEIKNREEEVSASFNQLKDKLKNLKTDITEEEYESDDVNALFDRLDNKMEQAQRSWQEHNLNNFDVLIKSTEALTNNARHFIKLKNSKNNIRNYWQTNDDEDKEEKDENEEKNEEGEDGDKNFGEWNKNGKKFNNKWGN